MDNLNLSGQRVWFAATYAGTTDNPDVAEFCRGIPLALLQDVCHEGEKIAAQVWTDWVQQFQETEPGTRVEFLATAYPSSNKKDYTLKEICWVQPPGDRLPLIKRECPDSQEDFLRILTLIDFAYKQLSRALKKGERVSEEQIVQLFEEQGCPPEGMARFFGWSDDIPSKVSALAVSGWCNPNPSPLTSYLEKCPELRALEYLSERSILQCCRVASWLNGATPWQAAGW